MDPAMAHTLWSDIGLTITGDPNGTIVSDTLFYGNFWNNVPNNHYLSSGQLFASLSIPVTGISIESYSYCPAVLTAYDAVGNVLATNMLLNTTTSFQFGTLDVTTTSRIAWFSVTGPTGDDILNLDNLTLTTPKPVPDPAATLLLGTGLAVTAFARRRWR